MPTAMNCRMNNWTSPGRHMCRSKPRKHGDRSRQRCATRPYNCSIGRGPIWGQHAAVARCRPPAEIGSPSRLPARQALDVCNARAIEIVRRLLVRPRTLAGYSIRAHMCSRPFSGSVASLARKIKFSPGKSNSRLYFQASPVPRRCLAAVFGPSARPRRDHKKPRRDHKKPRRDHGETTKNHGETGEAPARPRRDHKKPRRDHGETGEASARPRRDHKKPRRDHREASPNFARASPAPLKFSPPLRTSKWALAEDRPRVWGCSPAPAQRR